MLQKLILVTGKMRSGKDTLADILIQHDPATYSKISFAEPLKELINGIARILGIVLPEKPRQLLQWIGTEWGRRYNPSMWLDILLHRLDRVRTPVVIVTDVRFANEWMLDSPLWKGQAEVLKVLVTCSEDTQLARGAEAEFLNHESEDFVRLVQDCVPALEYGRAVGSPDVILSNDVQNLDYYRFLVHQAFGVS